MDDDGEISKVTISDETLKRKKKRKKGEQRERKELSEKVFLQFVLKRKKKSLMLVLHLGTGKYWHFWYYNRESDALTEKCY